jgi:hypothetical protein
LSVSAGSFNVRAARQRAGRRAGRLGVGVRALALVAAATLLPCVCAHGRGAARAAQLRGDDLQPFVAQVRRLAEALEYLGEPFAAAELAAIERAANDPDAARALAAVQRIVDRRVLFHVEINPESRVSVRRGAAEPVLVEKGWRVFLVKVKNDAGVTAPLRASSPQALPVYARGVDPDIPGGFSRDPVPRQKITPRQVADRWLDMAMFDKQPLEPALSGLPVEYRVVQLYSRDAGRREARVGFDVGQGTQDIGFRNDVSVLFRCLPSHDVTLRVRDERGRPATASFRISDRQGRTYPAKYKRLAPDFSFHPQIYRADGEKIRLPAGDYSVEVWRGPEYLKGRRTLAVGAFPAVWSFDLKRWIDPAALGWYSGDPHIHAAGCSHYEAPTQGVLPQDMIRHIVGEALNVGDVLTWGPCYYHQKQFFEARVNPLSTAENLMRYDVEVSGFPSSHAGHLSLLNLKEQDYPGAGKIEDWPTWDLPILKWARSQGAVAGFAHSGWGLEVKTDELPNYEMPRFDGVGANEYVVDVTHGAVDFIAGVDTPHVWELNVWYHTLNSGFRTRFVGETDFPCITAERVGGGRTYVRLDGRLDYAAWIEGLRDGRSYVSDGRSHLVDFRVDDLAVGTRGSELRLDAPRRVRVTAKVAALLAEEPDESLRGKPYNQTPYWDLERARVAGTREVPVEVVVNGRAVARRNVVADGALREIALDVAVERSSWIALRILPSSHTNPVFVTVAGRPVRASRRSAEWCLRAVDQCWSQKAAKISVRERPAAERAYEQARDAYRRIIAESDID